MNTENDKRNYIGLFILYALLAFSFLSPIASNIALPPVIDFYLHTNGVIQGSIALTEGQFPIRVSPSEHSGLGYPLFQFYSPFTYTIAGYIYKIFTPTNPFLALKILIWSGLIIAAFYIYRLAKQIINDSIAAILAGAAYIASPYLLINIIARGAITEVLGECILPIVLFYTVQPYLKNKFSINNILVSGLMWSILALVHLITFVNASIMIALFIFFYKTEERFIKLIFTGLAYIYGFVLAAWYLGPVVIYQSMLNISNTLINPTIYNHLTLFSRLCAIVSTGIISSLSYSRTTYDTILSPPFYPAVGFVILLAVGLCSYVVWINPNKFKLLNASLIKLLLILFFLAFFLTWSPIDFWKYLPNILVIEQFSYRFLAQVIWIGVLLVAIAINILTNGKNPLQTLILGLMVIFFSSSSWLMEEYGKAIPLSNIMTSQNVGMTKIVGITDAYLMKSTQKLDNATNNTTIIMDHKNVGPHCNRINATLGCQLSTLTGGLFEFPIIFYPKLLNVKVDGERVAYFPSKFEEYYLTLINLKPGHHTISIKFVGLVWANWLSLIAWFILLVMGVLHFIKNLFKRRRYIPEMDLAEF